MRFLSRAAAFAVVGGVHDAQLGDSAVGIGKAAPGRFSRIAQHYERGGFRELRTYDRSALSVRAANEAKLIDAAIDSLLLCRKCGDRDCHDGGGQTGDVTIAHFLAP